MPKLALALWGCPSCLKYSDTVALEAEDKSHAVIWCACGTVSVSDRINDADNTQQVYTFGKEQP